MGRRKKAESAPAQMSDVQIAKAFKANGGRPKPLVGVKPPKNQKYKPELCKDLIQFFTVDHFREVPETWYNTDGSVKRESLKMLPNPPPFLTAWCRKVGIDKALLYRWEDKYPEFKLAMEYAKGLRKEMVLSNGLSGLYNPLVVKLFAGHYFAMYDKQDVKLTHDVSSMLVKYYKPDRPTLPHNNHANQFIKDGAAPASLPPPGGFNPEVPPLFHDAPQSGPEPHPETQNP